MAISQAGRQAFAAARQAVLDSIDRLDRTTVINTVRLINELRAQVVREIKAAWPESYYASYFGPELRDALDRIYADFRARFGGIIGDAQFEGVNLGRELLDRPLSRIGVSAALPDISANLLAVAANQTQFLVTGFTADLARRVGAEIEALRSEIAQAAAAGRALLPTMEGIKSLLATPTIRDIRADTVAGRPSLEYQAERIARAEVGRVQSEATKLRFEQYSRTGVNLYKRWLSTMDPPRARPDHMQLHNVTIPEADMFDVAGTRAYGPRDNSLPPEQSINCRCTLAPVLGEDVEAVA